MMNNPLVIAQSEAFAKRIAADKDRIADQIESAFVLSYGRPPTSGERTAAASFFRSFAPTTRGEQGQFGAGSFRGGPSRGSQYRAGQYGVGQGGAGQYATLSAFCQSLFASAEFRYID
jgi:hypothetical protein